MSTDALRDAQDALDNEDAGLELDRIANVHAELARLRLELSEVAARHRAIKRRIRDLGYDLQHRLDQAAKRRVKARDARVAADLASKQEGVKGGRGKR
jgi:hypothetical protein